MGGLRPVCSVSHSPTPPAVAAVWADRGSDRAPSRRERVVVSQLAADKADVERRRADARAEVARQRLYFEQARVARGSPPRDRPRAVAPAVAGALLSQLDASAAPSEAPTDVGSDDAEEVSSFGGADSTVASEVQRSPAPSTFEADSVADGMDHSGTDSDGSGGTMGATRRVGDLQGMVDARRREAAKLALAVKERALNAELKVRSLQ